MPLLALALVLSNPGVFAGLAAGNGVALITLSHWIERWQDAHGVELLREPRSLATKRQAPRPRSNGQPRLLRPASHWIGLTSPMSQEPGRTRESGMRWALRFFALTRDQRRQPVPSQTIQAAVILAVIGLAVWLATNSSHHALSLHRVAAAVFGVGLGTALAGGVSRWRAKRRHDS